MADNTSIIVARTRLTVAYENAVRATGERLHTLAQTLLEEGLDAPSRGNFLFSSEGRTVWSGIHHSEVAVLREAYNRFETIVRDTESGNNIVERILMEVGSWDGDKDPHRLENLRGSWAEVIKYLQMAGFQLQVEPVNNWCFWLHVSR